MRWLKSTVPKFSDMPRLIIMYCVRFEHSINRISLDQIGERTIGSCGTGLADISTAAFAPTPPELSVHEIWLSDTHVMYLVISRSD